MPQTPIASDPKIMIGKSPITGIRITAELIVDKLATEATVDMYRAEIAVR